MRRHGKNWDFVIIHQHVIEITKNKRRCFQGNPKRLSDFQKKVTHVKMLLWKSEKNCTDLSLPKQASIHPAEYPAWSPSRSQCRLLMLSIMDCRLIPSWRCNIFRSVCKSAKSTKKQKKGTKMKSQSLCICTYYISALCRTANHGRDLVIIRESSINFKNIPGSDLRNEWVLLSSKRSSDQSLPNFTPNFPGAT